MWKPKIHFIFWMMRGENFMSKEKTIEGLIIEPNQFPRKLKIENELSALQKAVKGYIECIDLPNGATLICNEEGKINGEPLNRILYDEYGVKTDVIAGTFIAVGFNDDGEFTSLTPTQYEDIKQQFFCPDMFFKVNNEIHMVNTDWQLNLIGDTEIAFTDNKTGEIKDTIICDGDIEQIRVCSFINGIRSEIFRGMSLDNSVIEIHSGKEPITPYFDMDNEER